jgi:gas vesicle protein
MSDDRNNNIGASSIAWFLAGLGLGTVAAILYAPKSGRETREAIVAGVDAGRENLASLGRKARQQISNVVASGKNIVTTTKRQVNAVVDAGREAIHSIQAEK